MNELLFACTKSKDKTKLCPLEHTACLLLIISNNIFGNDKNGLCGASHIPPDVNLLCYYYAHSRLSCKWLDTIYPILLDHTHFYNIFCNA